MFRSNAHIAQYLLALVLVVFFSCKRSETIRTEQDKPEVTINDSRQPVVTLDRDTVYIISRSFFRQTGEQLVIEAGTLIKLDPGVAITIEQGGLIVANGTAEDPIVMTSTLPPGLRNANWGGLIINGRSYDNAVGSSGDPADVSGSVQYVRLEFGSLRMTGVGNGTIVRNVQVSYASSNAFEFNGGNFDARYLVSYACQGPSDYYLTRGYTGRLQHLLAHRHPLFGGNLSATPFGALSGLFIENSPFDPFGATPQTNPQISNLSVIGPNNVTGTLPAYTDTLEPQRTAALITTGNTRFRIRNSIFLAFPAAGWFLDDLATGEAFADGESQLRFSIFHSNDTNRVFYILPGLVPDFGSAEFKAFLLNGGYNLRTFSSAAEFLLEDPFNYSAPDPRPEANAGILQGANFEGAPFNDAFYNKVEYLGAVGRDNWLEGWTNFTPINEQYNYPK